MNNSQRTKTELEKEIKDLKEKVDFLLEENASLIKKNKNLKEGLPDFSIKRKKKVNNYVRVEDIPSIKKNYDNTSV